MSATVMVESSPEFVSPVIPDRADQPVTETTERFMRAIVERIPVGNIEELHLFSPLRQGAIETGIAVVASRVIEVSAPEVEVETTEAEPPELSLSDSWEREAESAEVVDDVVEAEADVAENEVVAEADVVAEHEVVAEADVVAEVNVDAEAPIDDEAPVDDDTSPPPIERHTVYTARYRLVIKGPERGRWEADVVEEADAPLLTVETVVRGVQRRAGEDTEIVRYNARQIAKILRVVLSE